MTQRSRQYFLDKFIPGYRIKAQDMDDLAESVVFKGEAGSPAPSLPASDFANVAYSATLNKAFNGAIPNFNVTGMAGNLTLNVTGTAEGDAGIVTIPKTTGSETITLNGTLRGLHTYPTGAGAIVSLTYIHETAGLAWYCNNPATPFPAKTAAERLAIVSPGVGLHVYQTDGGINEGVWVNKSTGWVKAY